MTSSRQPTPLFVGASNAGTEGAGEFVRSRSIRPAMAGNPFSAVPNVGATSGGAHIGINPITGTIIRCPGGAVAYCYRSTDRMASWTTPALPDNGGSTGYSVVAWVGGNNWLMIRYTSPGNATIFSTDDGVTWGYGGVIPYSAGSSSTFTPIAYGNDICVFPGWSGAVNDRLQTTADYGQTWTYRQQMPSQCRGLVFAKDRFIWTDDSTNLQWSYDGIAWNSLPIPAAGFRLAYGNGILAGGNATNLYWSNDLGLTWKDSGPILGVAQNQLAFGAGVFAFGNYSSSTMYFSECPWGFMPKYNAALTFNSYAWGIGTEDMLILTTAAPYDAVITRIREVVTE